MIFLLVYPTEQIELEDIKIENVTKFTYLGSLLTRDNDCSKEIGRRIGRATGETYCQSSRTSGKAKALA